MQITSFQSSSLCAQGLTGGWWGWQLSIHFTAADLSDPAHPHSYPGRAIHTNTLTHTMAWDLLTQAIFSPCPLGLLPFSNHGMIMSFQGNNDRSRTQSVQKQWDYQVIITSSWINVWGRFPGGGTLVGVIISHVDWLNSPPKQIELLFTHSDTSLKIGGRGVFRGIWPRKIP